VSRHGCVGAVGPPPTIAGRPIGRTRCRAVVVCGTLGVRRALGGRTLLRGRTLVHPLGRTVRRPLRSHGGRALRRSRWPGLLGRTLRGALRVPGAGRLLDVIWPLGLSLGALCSLHAFSTLGALGRPVLGLDRRGCFGRTFAAIVVTADLAHLLRRAGAVFASRLIGPVFASRLIGPVLSGRLSGRLIGLVLSGRLRAPQCLGLWTP
jgi:hypothetical protein